MPFDVKIKNFLTGGSRGYSKSKRSISCHHYESVFSPFKQYLFELLKIIPKAENSIPVDIKPH
jgi:hypothetical protein